VRGGVGRRGGGGGGAEGGRGFARPGTRVGAQGWGGPGPDGGGRGGPGRPGRGSPERWRPRGGAGRDAPVSGRCQSRTATTHRCITTPGLPRRPVDGFLTNIHRGGSARVGSVSTPDRKARVPSSRPRSFVVGAGPTALPTAADAGRRPSAPICDAPVTSQWAPDAPDTAPHQSPGPGRGGWREPGLYEGFLATPPGQPLPATPRVARNSPPRRIPRHTPPTAPRPAAKPERAGPRPPPAPPHPTASANSGQDPGTPRSS